MSYVVTYGWGKDRQATQSMSKSAASVALATIKATDPTLKPKVQKLNKDGSYNA
jgi:hypothetical protein